MILTSTLFPIFLLFLANKATAISYRGELYGKQVEIEMTIFEYLFTITVDILGIFSKIIFQIIINL